MERYLQNLIIQDLPRKIVLLTGPQQCGKTTIAKQLFPQFDYFNYDLDTDRLALKVKAWDRKKPLVIFDELHKMPRWKAWLKGIYDTEGVNPNIIVTGSAKLDTYRKMGDSLAGRYFQYQLHPLDIKEALQYSSLNPEEIFNRLLTCGGFPEPFLVGDEQYYKRWRRTHLDIILRQDLMDIYSVRNIKAIETLVLLLKERVGGTVSYANLARDLECDANTVKRWLNWLENLYIIFRVTPYHKNIARSLLKEPKYYFYDNGQVLGDAGAKLENLVACALFKELQFLEDTIGCSTALHFLRTKEGKELDFLVLIDNKPTYCIEVKVSDNELASSIKHFRQYFPQTNFLQLVRNLTREKTYPDGTEMRALIPWLSQLDLRT